MLRERDKLAGFRSYVYVTDDTRLLLGVAPLYQLIMEEPSTSVSAFMVPNPIHVFGTDDQLEVVAVFRQRHFQAVPVTDLEGRLMGIVTAPTGLHVLRHTAAKLRREAGESVEGVSSFLDHSSLAVTTVYLRRIEGVEDRTWGHVTAAIGV